MAGQVSGMTTRWRIVERDEPPLPLLREEDESVLYICERLLRYALAAGNVRPRCVCWDLRRLLRSKAAVSAEDVVALLKAA